MRDVYEPPPPRGHPAHDERRRRDRDPRNDREYYSSRDPYYGGDSYRDRGDRYDGYAAYGREDNYRPPPPPPQPLRRRSPDRYDAPDSGFTFRGAAGRDTHQRPLEDFSFRAPGPQFPAPTGPAATRLPHAPQPDNRVGGGRGGRVGRGRQNDRGGRRWAAKPHVSDRDILHETGRARTPEQLEGMNIDGQVRFRAVETSSDESDYNAAAPHSSSEEEGEIRRKRFKVGTPPAALNEAPKWSNPDPYTSLPAQPFGNAPRKDIVQVIRKAKAEPAPRLDVTQSATAKNDDFISFTFDDDLNMDGDSAADEREDNAMNDDSDVEFVGENPVKGLNSFNGINPPKGPSAPAINLRAAGRGNQGGVKAAPPPALTEMTEEEQLGQQAGGKKAKKRKLEDLAIGLGEVTPEWATKNASESTPWFTIDKTGTVDADLRCVL